MNITLTSGPSTVSNIYITPPTAPTIARSVVVPESPHHDNIALFCANICKTDSQLRRFVIPLEHSNDPPVPTPSVTAWPPTISSVDVLLEVLFLQTVTNRNDSNGPQLVNIGAINNGEESSSRTESWFCISKADGRVRVWRRRGESYADAYVMERDSCDGQNIMVWGAIGINHKAIPVIFQNTGPGRGNGVTALWYISQVLRLHTVPYVARHQQDNARAHTTRATSDFLQHHNIRTVPWPALSPDLNPTERW